MEEKTGIPGFVIKKAEICDVPAILFFIRKLAEYEKLLYEVVATEESLRETLFGETRYAEAILGIFNGSPIGFALFFNNYSTFLGKPGIYLEDLYVRPEMRGKGFGKTLLAYIARLAISRNCGRLEWSVLDWNKPAIDFYESLGAVPMNEWTVNRMTGDALKNLAEAK